ncbi:carbohydrate sulfotransferase 1-like [Palaemon carinicauda]|uniref:carbohydrate sulfotransferase 1-like n=1 Tax=Palaemon carinicauda TaxID=392227 RepID=UPI0035B5760A
MVYTLWRRCAFRVRYHLLLKGCLILIITVLSSMLSFGHTKDIRIPEVYQNLKNLYHLYDSEYVAEDGNPLGHDDDERGENGDGGMVSYDEDDDLLRSSEGGLEDGSVEGMRKVNSDLGEPEKKGNEEEVKDNGEKSHENEGLKENANKGKGYPRVVMLWTTWRSGSTFLGDLLVSAVNETFYSYEPLIPYGVRIFRYDDEHTRDALTYLTDLFRCDLTNHKWQVRRMAQEKCYRRRNTYLMKNCADSKVDCGNPTVISNACKSANFHFAKVLRLGLVWARKLLDDPSLDLQIIYMVRDPRPSDKVDNVNSRKPYGWCRSDCRNITNVCRHLRFDLQDSRQLEVDYPDRFKFIQYEKLSLDTETYVKDLWNFLHLDMTEAVMKKVRDLTSNNGKDGAFDTNRDTTEHTFSWRQKMAFESVAEVQRACDDVIRQLGLRSFPTNGDLRNMKISTFLSKEDEST